MTNTSDGVYGGGGRPDAHIGAVGQRRGGHRTNTSAILDGAVRLKVAASEADILAARLRVLEARVEHQAAQLRRELRTLEAHVWTR
jgi:hypothetical protein